jgi:hypothetical protein
MSEHTSNMIDGVNRAMSAANGQRLPDLQDVPDAAAAYEAWISERMLDEELSDIKEWCRLTLACAPLPCVCLNRTCLRCRVAALVTTPEPQPEPSDEPPPF